MRDGLRPAIGDRISRVYSDSLEETLRNLLQSLGKLNRPYLTGLEEKLLGLIEREYGVDDRFGFEASGLC
ncbi:hypothetical protein [Nostoc sp.]|uniref:hypothetical protein n=1 Tax=Nostoc sp. TaxID=1180 RepID=UPI002FFCCFB1